MRQHPLRFVVNDASVYVLAQAKETQQTGMRPVGKSAVGIVGLQRCRYRGGKHDVAYGAGVKNDNIAIIDRHPCLSPASAICQMNSASA